MTGHGWSSARLAPYRLVSGEAPSDAGQVVLDSRLAARAGIGAGDPAAFLVRGTVAHYRVAGLVSDAGDTVFFTDEEAARLTGHPDRVDTLAVFPAPGTDTGRTADAVKAALHASPPDVPLAVLTGDDRGRAEDPKALAEAGDLIPLAAAFGGLAAMVTVFVVAGTLGLSIRRRQREMALLRLIGATPGRIRRMVAVETLVLSAVATALAWYPGPWFGRLLLERFTDAGVVPDVIAFRSGEVPPIAGTGIGLATAVAAALVAAHTAARSRPSEALTEAVFPQHRLSRVRLVAGLLCVGGGVLLARGTAGADGPDASGVATPAVMVWVVAFGLLGPPLIRALTAFLRRPLRRAGVAGELAAANAEARPGRLASAVMPVMLAVGLALGLVYMHATEAEGRDRAFADMQRADLVVSSASGGLPPTAVDEVKAVPGVMAATAQVRTTGYLEPATPPGHPSVAAPVGDGPQPTELPLYGVTPDGLDTTTSFRAVSGSLTELHGAAVALPTRYAKGRNIGDTVPMRLGDGSRVDLVLVATIDARAGYETAVVPAAFLIGHTDAGPVGRIMVRTAPEADPAQVASGIASLAELHPGLSVAGRGTLAHVGDEQDRTQQTMAALLLAVVVGYAAISLVNTQILAIAERRRELALLRLLGASRRQVLRTAAAEGALVSAAGILLGAAVAALTLVPVGLSVLGSPVPGGSPRDLVVAVAAAAGLTTATTVAATAMSLRRRFRHGT
ncbi:MAG: FtsX-like permease family protein [Streptomycetaceae bacterium]|nr:FtsX-like permease family protein [Streptomycetaceae bacterium]